MLRVVFDTKLFVQAILTKKGICALLLTAWKRNHYILISSTDIVGEIERVLIYQQIRGKYNLTEADIEDLISLLESEAAILSEIPKLNIIQDYPPNNKFLDCAIAGDVDYIVAGDAHLLGIKKIKKIPIISASHFVKILGSKL